MSKPRAKWWGYVRNILRAYPRMSRDPDPTDMDRLELDAVAQAMEETSRLPDGELRLSLVSVVFFDRSHTLECAAETVGVSYPTARKMTGSFMGLVWRHLDAMLERRRRAQGPPGKVGG